MQEKLNEIPAFFYALISKNCPELSIINQSFIFQNKCPFFFSAFQGNFTSFPEPVKLC